MTVERTIKVSDFVYKFYEEVARKLGDCTTEEAMAAALESYALQLFEEMVAEDTISEQKPKLTLHQKER